MISHFEGETPCHTQTVSQNLALVALVSSPEEHQELIDMILYNAVEAFTIPYHKSKQIS